MSSNDNKIGEFCISPVFEQYQNNRVKVKIQITVKLSLTKLSVIKVSPSSKRLTFTKSTHPRHVINKCQDIPFIIATNYMGRGNIRLHLSFVEDAAGDEILRNHLKHTKKSKMEFRLAVFEIRCSFLS